ncbi:MAG: hypothetical protein K6U77_08575 [Armatimonadetes bacterium]|nr:hypothetical protein [Armatimonadota bacterium]
MHAQDPLPEIVNLAEAEQAAGMPLRTPDALRQAGYRLVKARDDGRYFLARESDLQPLLVKLGDIAEVRFGIKTGANEFFYLEPVGTTVAELFRVGAQLPSQPTVRVRNGAGWQGELETAWLRPVIKSPRELKTLRARLEDLRYLVFMPPDDVRERLHDTAYLKQHYPHAHAYIQWGEGQGYHLRPTCKGRVKWWELVKTSSKILALRATNDRPAFYYSPTEVCHDQTFYSATSQWDESLFSALLNCSFTNWLLREVESGASAMLGLGALWAAVYEIQNLQIPNPAVFTASQRERLLKAFERMAQREVRSIFEELGYPKPDRDYGNIDPNALTLAQVQRASPDRFELDAVVFEVLGLDDAERLAVYRAVVELVRNRLVKAKRV